MNLPAAILALAVFAFASAPRPASGATLYADPSLPEDCAGSYDAAARSCGKGNETAYRTLGAAAAAARPGDVVSLRGGVFSEALIPARSGEPGSPVVFRGHPAENAVITVADEPAIFLKERSWIVIEGLTVQDSQGWGRIEASSHVVFRKNRFLRAIAHGTTGGLKFVRSSLNSVLENRFEEGTDSVVLQESDRNVVQGNDFVSARHSLLSVRCGNFNVIRGNRFRNEYQKAAEIYDCEGVSDAPVRLNATRHNLFEGNTFARTRGSSRYYRYNGIQYGGQEGIVRGNVFYGNEGGGLSFQVYPDEALYVYGHRVFNNTFYDNRCYGVSASGALGRRYEGNIVMNNLFYKNVDCEGRPRQVRIGDEDAVRFENNALLKTSPGFENEAEFDLRPTAGSPAIDAGAFATRAVGTGNGAVLPVADTGFFFDGFGIPGEVGDLIRLEGDPLPARILEIDREKGTLRLDRSVSWTEGRRIHLRYRGKAPDLGAFEFPAEGK